MALSDAVTAIQQMQQRIGMPGIVHGNFTGTAQAFQASLASEPFLILAALVAVYIVSRHSLRELHSSDHNLVNTAIRQCRSVLSSDDISTLI